MLNAAACQTARTTIAIHARPSSDRIDVENFALPTACAMAGIENVNRYWNTYPTTRIESTYGMKYTPRSVDLNLIRALRATATASAMMFTSTVDTSANWNVNRYECSTRLSVNRAA